MSSTNVVAPSIACRMILRERRRSSCPSGPRVVGEVVAEARRDRLLAQVDGDARAHARREVVGLDGQARVEVHVDVAELLVAAERGHVAQLGPPRRGGRDDVGRRGGDDVDEERPPNPQPSVGFSTLAKNAGEVTSTLSESW